MVMPQTERTASRKTHTHTSERMRLKGGNSKSNRKNQEENERYVGAMNESSWENDLEMKWNEMKWWHTANESNKQEKQQQQQRQQQ